LTQLGHSINIFAYRNLQRQAEFTSAFKELDKIPVFSPDETLASRRDRCCVGRVTPGDPGNLWDRYPNGVSQSLLESTSPGDTSDTVLMGNAGR
jgi:hypothetical protein